jgi:predicted DCC family thiol-disulfide oxidoreductase YuxK
VGAANNQNSIVFYDGICGLCNRFVQFVMQRDGEKRFRFAALHSDTAHHLLQPYRVHLSNVSTVCVMVNPGSPEEKLFTQSDAAVEVTARLGGMWPMVSFLLKIIPRSLRDWGYRSIARRRYQIFGKYDSCPVADPKDAGRFLG